MCIYWNDEKVDDENQDFLFIQGGKFFYLFDRIFTTFLELDEDFYLLEINQICLNKKLEKKSFNFFFMC